MDEIIISKMKSTGPEMIFSHSVKREHLPRVEHPLQTHIRPPCWDTVQHTSNMCPTCYIEPQHAREMATPIF